MYKKVSSDMNFVDREKETVKFWIEKTNQQKQTKTDHQQPMVNLISDTF